MFFGLFFLTGCSADPGGITKSDNGEIHADQKGIEKIQVDFTVRVRNEQSRKPTENAEIKLDGEVAYTNVDGTVTFKGIEAGSYKLEVQADGFQNYSFDEVIVNENTLPFRVNLLPIKDYEILYGFTSNAKQIWSPVPVYWDGNGTLAVEIIEINPIPTRLYTDEHGNQIAYWHNPQSSNVDYSIHYIISVSEIRHDLSGYSLEYDQDSELFKTYTAPDEMTQSADPRIISQAEEIIKDAVDPVEKVNKIADWVIININPGEETYSPDALSILDNRVGSCGHFTNIFTALCRASGIPTRNVSVFSHPYEHDFQSGKLFEGFYTHLIAEFYLQDYGWVQVDPTRHSVGRIKEDIIIMSKGNYFTLEEAGFRKKYVAFHLPAINSVDQVGSSFVEVKRLDSNN
jgi:hypothetical protein